MDGSDRELGWEDVGGNAQDNPNAATAPSFMGGLSGSLGSPGEGNAPLSDAVTSAMVSHFANEFTKGSLTFWPQFMQTSRQYFNVNHGYVLRKMLWLIVPMPTPKKKSGDGELGGEKDWSVRVFEGLEVEIEEPDMYIPVMSFVTYVLLCGLVRGLQEQFNPDFLSSTMTFSMVVLILEVTVAKAALFMAGAVNAPIFDLAALFGYKYLHLSAQIIFGILLGRGVKPVGILYHLLALCLMAGCGVALWQALRKIARMQPASNQEAMAVNLHQMLIKALPVMQVIFYWFLLPSWPKRAATEAAAVAAVAAAATLAPAAAPAAPAAKAAVAAVTTTTSTLAAATAAAGAKS
mmetsp:Transcript_144284/g.268911  ORF Transcript_144284/g.268911 Transcript_144284/m.268911 type:complete len:349 (-) Transcript_144284:119-1165(-)